MTGERLLSIGSFSLISGLSIPTLRYYADVGVLRPADVDPDTGYRRYRRDQLRTARLARALRAVDMPVEAVRAAVALQHDPDGLYALLTQHRARLDERAETLERMRGRSTHTSRMESLCQR